MSELVRVAVDAMGGDHAPEAVVQGVVDALNASKEIEVLLVGDQTAIEKCLTGAQYDKTRLQVIHASAVIWPTGLTVSDISFYQQNSL